MRSFIDRFKFFLFFLYKVKIKLKLPKKKKLIFFDCQTRADTEILLKKYKYFELKTRLESIDEIYLNIKIIKYFFIYYKGSIKLAYLSAIIHFIKPKLILTFIDYSIIFSELEKIFYP
jgi:surface carbohydrate biosynthesis protein